MKTLISSKKEAATSEKVVISEYKGFHAPNFPATIWAWNIDGTEEILIRYPTDVEDEYVTIDKLTADNPSLALNSPMEFIVEKPSTAYNVGVAMFTAKTQFAKEMS